MGNVFHDAARSGERYAILFAGTGDPATLNDLEFCWRMLTGPYEFAPGNIQVLYFSGRRETNDPDRPASVYPGPLGNDAYSIRVDRQATASDFAAACLGLS